MISRRIAVFAGALLGASAAHAQLRVAAWNITNYSGGRVGEFQTSIYGEFEGRSMSPDAILLQEVLSQSGVDAFVALLNSASGSPGDWAAAPFFNGPDTDNAFVYRTSKLELLAAQTIAFGGGAPNHPRNVERYDVRLVGYGSEGATISMYSSHMKAGSSSTDQARRLVEAQRIRDNAETLPAARHFLLGGDFNIQSSGQSAYQEMVGSQLNNDGRFFDPIFTPGSWNNNGAFRFVHTQDPSGAGGMDDRHDQILVSDSLLDGEGMDYLGLPVPYSTTTWDDPNHSYRSWGNDGSSYNAQINTATNSMVGPMIATALRNHSSQGHLPVFMDILVPPVVASPDLIDLGNVDLGSMASASFNVENGANTALWGELGVNTLVYSFGGDATLTLPGGSFSDEATAGANTHDVAIDTSVAGPFSATLEILSNDPDAPVREVMVVANVRGACPGDVTGDGFVDFTDLNIMLSQFGDTGAGLAADLDGDGDVDFTDLNELLSAFGDEC